MTLPGSRCYGYTINLDEGDAMDTSEKIAAAVASQKAAKAKAAREGMAAVAAACGVKN